MNTASVRSDDIEKELIGLIPAAGKASRLGHLPCSKEIYPVGFGPAKADGTAEVRVSTTGLLESMHLAGVERAFIILRHGKWDIPAYYGDGAGLEMNLAYLMMRKPYGAPYTLDQAYPFIQNATIVFGFPDILFQPKDAFIQLLARQSATGAPIVLGAFKADNPAKVDMLVTDDQKRVVDIVIKPDQTRLTHTWILAVWNDQFSRYLHAFVADDLRRRRQHLTHANLSEIYVGDVIRTAIKARWPVETVFFNRGAYLDVGTPEDMIKAMSNSNWTDGG